MVCNIKSCLGHHPLPSSEKTTAMKEIIDNKETEFGEGLRKEDKVAKVKPREDFQRGFYQKYLSWYSFSNSENNAFDLFFRRFYV